MKDVISIGASSNVDLVKNCLNEELTFLKNKGIIVSMEERDYGTIKYIGCNVDGETANSSTVFRYYIAKALTEFIANELPLSVIPRLIRHNYAHFSEAERDEIIARAVHLFKADMSQGNLYKTVQRKNQIATSLLEYLNLNNELVLEGFLRFRLKEFCDELNDYVDQAVDSFMIDREYEEFVALLRYFVEVQDPKMGEAHIVARENGLFRILDRNQQVVKNEYLEGFVVELVQNQIDYEDLLLSALITLSPVKIVLHLDPQAKISTTVLKVFTDRAQTCIQGTECSLCNYRLKNEED